MKTVATTLAMAVALGASLGSAEELCSPGSPLTAPVAFTDPSLTATNCVWASDTALSVNPNVTSLAITGGHTEGPVTINLFPVDALQLTISGGFESKKGTLYFNGELPPGSSITITNSHFYAVGSGYYLSAVDFEELMLHGTALHINQNSFHANADTDYSYVLRLPYGNASNFVVEDNFFNLTEKWGAGVAMYMLFLRSSLAVRRNRFVADTTAYASAVELAPSSYLDYGKSFKRMSSGDARSKDRDGKRQEKRRSGGKRRDRSPFTKQPKSEQGSGGDARDPSSPMRQSFRGTSIQWGNVTDDEARYLYGKSSYEIVDNEFVNAEYPWYIQEYDGKDMVIARNTMVHTSLYLEPYTELYNAYFPVTVSMIGNTFNATEYIFNEVDFYEMPEKSTYSLSGNTYITIVQSESYPIQISGRAEIPESSALLINDNELIDISDVNKTVGYVPAESYLVGYTYRGGSYYYPDLTPTNIGKFALCNNVMYGVKLDTDALVNSSFYWRYQPLTVTPVSECGAYTTTTTTTATTTTTTASSLSTSEPSTTLENETEPPTRIITNDASGRGCLVSLISVALFGLIALV